MQRHLRMLAKDGLRSTIGRAGDALLPPAGKFAIFTRGRTGSNLLTSLLKSHSQIRDHGEIFGEYRLGSRSTRKRINDVGPVAYFDWTTRRMLLERVVGVKVLYYQLEPDYAERWKVPPIPAILPVLVERRDLKVIHLKRRNKLATLVSIELARRTRSYTGGSYGGATVRLSVQECLDEFRRIERWEREYDETFASHPFVEIYYEDLAADTDTEMRRVLGLLGLDPARLSSPMRKQNTRSFAKVIENFGELEAEFAGTPYSQFFR